MFAQVRAHYTCSRKTEIIRPVQHTQNVSTQRILTTNHHVPHLNLSKTSALPITNNCDKYVMLRIYKCPI